MNGQRVARLATDAVVRQPWVWRFLRGRLRDQFDRIAPTWETRIGPHHVAALDAALGEVVAPGHALDLGTGTGVAAKAIAARFPTARVTGLDISPAMIAEAEARLPSELAGRVSYQVGDASALPFADAAFGLVTLMNMIPFFDELARVVSPGGNVVVSFSRGAQTPIYVARQRLERELGRRDFTEFADFSAGSATALRATRG